MTKTIAKITPLIRLPSSVDIFDYFVPKEMEPKIKVGQMVSIPWRNRYANGVILSFNPLFGDPSPEALAKAGGDAKGRFRARPVKKIIEPQPILTPAQLALIKKFSEYYFVSQGSVARLIAPIKPARIVTPANRNPVPMYIGTGFRVTKSQLPLLEETILSFLLKQESSKKTNGVYYLATQDISSFVWLIFYLLKKQTAVLLLLPTINLINILSAALKKYQAQTAVIHSGLAPGAYWQAYQKILQGQAKIILSTRQGVFLPIAANSTIIMFDSASQDFKQYDQHPRYDARLVARWTAELTKSQLILTNPSPFQEECSPSPLPLGEGRVRGALPTALRQKTSIQLADMKQKLQSPEFDIVSDEVVDEISQAKAARKKTVIIALREQADKGVSVNKINDALTKLLKGDKNDIIAGAPALLESGRLLSRRGQITCLILASIEPLLAIPDFRAGERALCRLKHWQMWAQELAIPKIILQSYSPENPAVRAFAYNETEHFIQTELENRKRFNYPPFAQLIKLTYQGKDEGEIARVAALLKARASDKLVVRGPYQAHKSEKKSILLKIPPGHAELVSASNDADLSFLRTLSSAWAVDRDPENVL